MTVARADKLASTAIPTRVALSEKFALSILEACELANCGRSQLYEAVQSGALQARKRGRSTLILPADLRAWVDSLPAFTPFAIPANSGRRQRLGRNAKAAIAEAADASPAVPSTPSKREASQRRAKAVKDRRATSAA
jgi:excisionase family DNA binding protein